MSIIPVILTANDARVFAASFTAVPLEDYSLAVKNISQILHPGEMAYFNTLKHERRQKSYLMGRYACKKVLSSYFNEPNLTTIEIVPGIFGQPVVRCLTREMPGVSLSHDNSFAAAIAFPDTLPMALDIETADEGKVKVINSQLTDAETNFAMSGILPEYLLCTLFWTAKEALSKLIKCGLTVRFTLLEAEIVENDCCNNKFHITFKNFPQYQACAWTLGNTVLSIVYPVKLEIDLNYEDIKNCLNKSPCPLWEKL
jgi:4'-phosphopantetheinyl transferase